jgi:hypothetical protein
MGWGDGSKDLPDASQSVGGQGDGVVQRVDNPAQENSHCGPGGVAFRYFLGGSRLLAVGRVFAVQGAKYRVQSVQEGTFDSTEGLSPALHHSQKIIYIDIP